MYRFIQHWFQNSYFLAYHNSKKYKYKDHFFWDLYEAQRSPDSKAMTILFERYS